ncbi:cuticle protein 7 [Haematobia irritans]|uniref:cuticle protein 7 n=1 Tax=Haematobia irritans TaxID=7368 RepID=UPI003F50C10C
MKLISFSFVLALCSMVNGGFIGHPAVEIHADSPPHYEFQYAVHDAHTGDIKDQFEHRRGEYVTGRYSLVEPDGQRRIVDYSSDPLLGFSAHVRRELVGIHGTSAVVEDWPAPATHRR